MTLASGRTVEGDFAGLAVGARVRVVATDPGFPADVKSWANLTGNRLIEVGPDNGRFVAVVEKSSPSPDAAGAPSNSEFQTPNSASGFTAVVFSGSMDRALASLVLANGAGKLKLSQWHFAGMGRRLMNYRMKSKRVMGPDELLASARAAGVRLVACQMSMDMLGLKREDLIDGVEVGGVANFMEAANAGRPGRGTTAWSASARWSWSSPRAPGPSCCRRPPCNARTGGSARSSGSCAAGSSATSACTTTA